MFYPELEKLLLDFFPGATDALVYNHDVFDKHYTGDRTEDQDDKNPGVNENYVNMVHNDLNDNSGRVRLRELLLRNLRNFGREQHFTEAEVGGKNVPPLHVHQPGEAHGDRASSGRSCSAPGRPSPTKPYVTNYRMSMTTGLARPRASPIAPSHEWYWFPQQTSTEVSMLKCYDSVTDGSVSRWSFHSALLSTRRRLRRRTVPAELWSCAPTYSSSALNNARLPATSFLC